MCERKKLSVGFAIVPIICAALIPSFRVLPLSNDMRGFAMGACIGISLAALAVAVRAQRC